LNGSDIRNIHEEDNNAIAKRKNRAAGPDSGEGRTKAAAGNGSRDYWKVRIVPLPDPTLNMLKEHIERKRLKDDDFIFASKNDPSRSVTESSIRDHMARIIREAGIPAQGRKLVINSFRYTFINRIRWELPSGVVMEPAGCKLFGITEHYHNRGIGESSAIWEMAPKQP
jgi:integrase